MKASLATLFTDFQRLVLAAERVPFPSPSNSSHHQSNCEKQTGHLNERFEEFIQASFKSLETYTDIGMDDLFDITLETNLVKETKDILGQLNMMQWIKRQHDSVLEVFEREMLHKESDVESGFHSSR